MNDLKKLYQGPAPSTRFRQSIHDAISSKKKYHKASNQSTSFFQKLQQRRFFSINIIPAFGVLGSLIILSLSVLFWWPGITDQTLLPGRLVFNEIPLLSAEDAVNWNQEHTIPPLQTVHLNIRESHSQPYYFHVSSIEPVDYSVTQNEEIQNPENIKRRHLQGIQYIILNNPQLQDVVHISNHGIHPISLKTSSHNPQAIQAVFK